MTELRRRRADGFTFVEIMVAIALFGIIAGMSFMMFSQSARMSRQLSDNMAELIELQRALQWFANDLSQLQPRPVRDPVGNTSQPALIADPRGQYRMALTRGGYANPLGVARASAQRVAYELNDDGELLRLVWPVLDPVLASEPEATLLLEGVERMELRFLPSAQSSWSEQWPAGAGGSVPRAVEITLEIDGWGEIIRLLEVGG